jgi:subtilase family serine protease
MPVDGNVRATLLGSVYPLAYMKNDRGTASASTAMNRMQLVLKQWVEQGKALALAIEEMGRLRSRSNRKWLTPEQIGASYGSSLDDIATVSVWLSSSGFRVTSVSRAGSLIEFSGTAGQVVSAFHVEVYSYEWNGKKYTANA